MSRSINKIILVGNVGRDPDIRTNDDGTREVNFSLATSERVPLPDVGVGYKEITEWHRLVLHGDLAQRASELVKKGDRLYIEGRMKYGEQCFGGITYPTAEVHVRELVFLNPRRA